MSSRSASHRPDAVPFFESVADEVYRGIIASDIDGQMRQYAHVLVALNGGQAGVGLFIRMNPLFRDYEQWGNALDCIKCVPLLSSHPTRRDARPVYSEFGSPEP